MPRFVQSTDHLADKFPSVLEQCQVAGALYSLRDFALVLCAGARLPARADFTIFRNESPQQIGIFIIQCYGMVGAKQANTGMRIEPATTTT
jgi:hypothetical protein